MKEKYKNYFYGFGAFAFFCIIMGMLMACHFVTELNKKNFEVKSEENNVKNDRNLYPNLGFEADSSPHITTISAPIAPNRAPSPVAPTRDPPPPPSTPVIAPPAPHVTPVSAPAPPFSPPVTPISAPAPPLPPPVTPVSAPAPPPPPTNQKNLADNLYSEQKELDNILQSLNSLDFDAPANPPTTNQRSVPDLDLFQDYIISGGEGQFYGLILHQKRYVYFRRGVKMIYFRVLLDSERLAKGIFRSPSANFAKFNNFFCEGYTCAGRLCPAIFYFYIYSI